MNQPDTSSPRPSETSTATQEEPLAIDKVTPDASKPPSPTTFARRAARPAKQNILAQHARDFGTSMHAEF